MTKATKVKDAGTKPETTETKDSSLPVWKTQHGRVQGAIWKRIQEDGKARFTISISRSYKDEDDKWKNVHYFDEKDLRDIHATGVEVEEQILSLKNLVQVVGED